MCGLKLGFTPVWMAALGSPFGAARRPRSLAGWGCLPREVPFARDGQRGVRQKHAPRSQLLFQNWNGPREPDC